MPLFGWFNLCLDNKVRLLVLTFDVEAFSLALSYREFAL